MSEFDLYQALCYHEWLPCPVCDWKPLEFQYVKDWTYWQDTTIPPEIQKAIDRINKRLTDSFGAKNPRFFSSLELVERLQKPDKLATFRAGESWNRGLIMVNLSDGSVFDQTGL